MFSQSVILLFRFVSKSHQSESCFFPQRSCIFFPGTNIVVCSSVIQLEVMLARICDENAKWHSHPEESYEMLLTQKSGTVSFSFKNTEYTDSMMLSFANETSVLKSRPHASANVSW